MVRSSLETQASPLRALTYPETQADANSCQRCQLHTTRNKVVFSQGPVPCKIMCIGEAPGADEDAQGIPFVGKAGKLLTKMLEAINLQRPDDVYIANTLKCRPPGNRAPLPAEIAACYPYLLRQIAEVKPRILILLGSPAMKTILNPDDGVSKIRGQWFDLKTDYMEEPLKVMTLFHPSYLLRNASKEVGTPKWLTWNDLKAIRLELDRL